MSLISDETSNSLHTLVTRNLVDTSKYFCPFLDRGFCRATARCNFSHDRQQSITIPNAYCHFYLANQCLYGHDCKFIHNEPPSRDDPLLVISADTFLNNIESNYNLGQGGSVENNEYEDDNNNIDHDYDEYADVTSEIADRLDDEVDLEEEEEEGYDNYFDDEGSACSHREQRSTRDRFVGRLRREPTNDWYDASDHQSDDNEDRSQTTLSQVGLSAPSKARNFISNRCVNNNNSIYTKATSKLPILDNAQTSSSSSNITILTTTHPSTSNNLAKLIPATRTSPSTSSLSSKQPGKLWLGARIIASIRSNHLDDIDEASNRSCNKEPNTSSEDKDLPLCPYSSNGECPYPDNHCIYLHGLICDLCCNPCLHPYNESQRRQHRDECLREHEREMELSFAVQRSKDKVCGICMDTVVDKKPVTSSRFGILEKCNHIFCLDCIRKWRGTKQFDSRTIRACPECRVSSDFVVPSKYWVEDQEDKDKLIQDYKSALR